MKDNIIQKIEWCKTLKKIIKIIKTRKIRNIVFMIVIIIDKLILNSIAKNSINWINKQTIKNN